MKKAKQPEFDKGEKIRDLKIDKSLNMGIMGVSLILLNCFLAYSAIMLAIWINFWFVWVLDCFIVAFCLYKSIHTFFHTSKTYKFSLYSNCVALNSLWLDNMVVQYNQIKKIKIRTSFPDRIFRHGTCTLTIFLNDELNNKISLYFLKENPQKLMLELMELGRATETK